MPKREVVHDLLLEDHQEEEIDGEVEHDRCNHEVHHGSDAESVREVKNYEHPNKLDKAQEDDHISNESTFSLNAFYHGHNNGE